MLAIGSDHAGYPLKLEVIKHLEERNIEYKDYGCYSPDSCDYAVFAEKTADAVASGECEKGLLFCGTGVGISIAANKVRGIRAACCRDEFSAEATRSHNDANILCMGARVIDEEKAKEFLEIFLNTPFSEGENHIRRIGKLERSRSEQ